MTDFIIVGRGLAASVLMHRFHTAGISFRVVGSETLSSSSRIAAGIYNPIVFKRMTMSWMADELVPELVNFFTGCEALLGVKLLTRRELIKPFTEDQEKQLWLKKSETVLRGFTDPLIHTDKPFDGLRINNGYGRVLNAGNVDLPAFLDHTAAWFKENIIDETFIHSALQVSSDKVSYNGTEARNIIFCEGHLVKDNPWFSWLPLKPAKGEVMTVAADNVGLRNGIFSRNGFLMDLPGGTFRLGATYEWTELNDTATEKGRLELEEKMRQMSPCTYTILRHDAGVRPSSADRRPLIGRHPVHENLFVFNGLGSKGVMLAPYFALNFVFFYLKKAELHREVNVERYYPLL